MDEIMEIEVPEDNYDLELSLPPAKFRAANLYLTGNYSYSQIAKIMGVDNRTISSWLKDEKVIEVMRKIQERELELNRLELNNLRKKAISTMEDLLNSSMEQVRLGAARDIMDRTGLKVINETKIEKNVTTTMKSSLEELADYLIEDADVIEIE